MTPSFVARSHNGLLEGLSRVRGNSHARFLGEDSPVTAGPYPTNS